MVVVRWVLAGAGDIVLDLERVEQKGGKGGELGW